MAGADGYAVDLSEAQWVELSAAVRGWHTARLPATLQRRLQTQAQDWVVCHADLHNGNSLIAKDGALYIVDWDTAMLAPPERDLMFVGSGLGRPGREV